jgi:hypothetical protein
MKKKNCWVGLSRRYVVPPYTLVKVVYRSSRLSAASCVVRDWALPWPDKLAVSFFELAS